MTGRPDCCRRLLYPASAKRLGTSESFNGCTEDISDATLGLDEARRARIAFELAPQAENLHVDAAIENILVNACGLQQVFTAEWALWRIEEGQQQRMLALGQGHQSAGRIGEPPRLAVELPPTKSIAATLRVPRGRGTPDVQSP